MEWIIGISIGLVVGATVAAYLAFQKGLASGKRYATGKAQEQEAAARKQAEELLAHAKIEAEKLTTSAKQEALKFKEQAQAEIAQERQRQKETEERLHKREEDVLREFAKLRDEKAQVEQKAREIDTLRAAIEAKHKEVSDLVEQERQALIKIAGLTKEEAIRMMLEKLTSEVEREKAELIRKRLEAAKEEAEQEARRIITMAIHRFAAPHTVESVVSLVDVPNEEMKGRIIGREGRNIRAFERETGVDVIIDDTPGTISLSAFDGVRREIARRAMERLIADGRIHPARIEEVVEQAKREMENEINQIGKQFLFDEDIHNVHPKLVTLVGRLQFRTSYGQNVLQHIKEVAHICGVMAAELGLDSKLARRCGIFHDIGKAVDHTFEGSHPQIGGELLRRFGESPEVIEAAEHHHSDPNIVKFPTTVLAAAADAISAARPGARGETLESYMKRVEKLEAIAKSFQGVVNAFAVHAGREIRVIVDAEQVSDDQATMLARDIAKSIEEQLTYPGEIKVTVMRERRIIEYAR